MHRRGLYGEFLRKCSASHAYLIRLSVLRALWDPSLWLRPAGKAVWTTRSRSRHMQISTSGTAVSSTEDRSTGPMHCYSYLMVGLKRHGQSDHAAPVAVSENVRDRRDNIRNSEIDGVRTSNLHRWRLINSTYPPAKTS